MIRLLRLCSRKHFTTSVRSGLVCILQGTFGMQTIWVYGAQAARKEASSAAAVLGRDRGAAEQCMIGGAQLPAAISRSQGEYKGA